MTYRGMRVNRVVARIQDGRWLVETDELPGGVFTVTEDEIETEESK